MSRRHNLRRHRRGCGLPASHHRRVTHEIIDWTLFESLRTVHTLAALDMTIAQVGSTDLPTLTHHSDRDSQYCYNVYIVRLNQIHAAISMTEDHKPTDYAIAERVTASSSPNGSITRNAPPTSVRQRVSLHTL